MSGTDGYMNRYVVGETYQLPKPTRSNADLFTGYSGSDPATITFSMEFIEQQRQAPEPELLCQQRGGNARAAKSGDIGNYSASLVATDAAGHTAAVYAWAMEVDAKATFEYDLGLGIDGCAASLVQLRATTALPTP